MEPSAAAPKICVACGKDVSGQKRAKDTQGNYYCATCWIAKLAAEKAAPSATLPPIPHPLESNTIPAQSPVSVASQSHLRTGLRLLTAQTAFLAAVASFMLGAVVCAAVIVLSPRESPYAADVYPIVVFGVLYFVVGAIFGACHLLCRWMMFSRIWAAGPVAVVISSIQAIGATILAIAYLRGSLWLFFWPDGPTDYAVIATLVLSLFAFLICAATVVLLVKLIIRATKLMREADAGPVAPPAYTPAVTRQHKLAAILASIVGSATILLGVALLAANGAMVLRALEFRQNAIWFLLQTLLEVLGGVVFGGAMIFASFSISRGSRGAAVAAIIIAVLEVVLLLYMTFLFAGNIRLIMLIFSSMSFNPATIGFLLRSVVFLLAYVVIGALLLWLMILLTKILIAPPAAQPPPLPPA